VEIGGVRHHLSSHFIGLANQTDAAAGGVPYVSPSNRAMQIDGCCLDDGTEVFLTQTQANVLNAAGIFTALNFTGWRSWGNRTAGYPASSDPKDVFIPIRRMNLWLGNTLVLTFFSQLDAAMNRRLIDSIVDSANIYLNGLKGQGAILGGECLFAEADNSAADLLNGQATFRIYWSPPPPASVLKEQMATMERGKKRGIAGNIELAKKLALWYGKAVAELAAGDVVRVKCVKNKDGFIRVVAVLPKEQIGQASAEAAKLASEIPF